MTAMTGRDVLVQRAPAAAELMIKLLGVPGADLSDEAIREFAEQFELDVARIDDAMRGAFFAAAGADAADTAYRIWAADMPHRGTAALDALFGKADWTVDGNPEPDLWRLLDPFITTVPLLTALDPVLTEIVRLRWARGVNCRICQSRRSVAAFEGGATEEMFEAIDFWQDADFDARTKAALALVDAMMWTPDEIPAAVIEAVRAHLSDDEALEVVLDTVRNATNKLAVALGGDAANVTDGVELFITDTEGNTIAV